MMYNQNQKCNYKPFKYNLFNLEQYLTDYDKYGINESTLTLEDSLKYIYRNIKKKMIIFIITDLVGLDSISTKILKTIGGIYDVLLINIEDAFMIGDNSYDLDSNSYIPKILLNDKKLNEIEKEIRKNLLDKNKRRIKKCKIEMVTIRSKEEIPFALVELLERHRYANNH